MAPLLAEVLPDKTWLKADIQAWLDERGIEYKSTDTVAILISKVGE